MAHEAAGKLSETITPTCSRPVKRWDGVESSGKAKLSLSQKIKIWPTPPPSWTELIDTPYTHSHIKYIHTRTLFSSVFNCVGNGIDFLLSWRDDITVRGEQHVGGSSACLSLVERTMIGQRSQRGRWKARDCVNILLQQGRKRAVKGVSYCFLTINAYTLTYHEWEGLHSDTDLIGKVTSDI